MKKTGIICIRMEPEMLNGLKLRAHFDNISVGELCRNLIKKGLKYENENNEHKKKNRHEDF